MSGNKKPTPPKKQAQAFQPQPGQMVMKYQPTSALVSRLLTHGAIKYSNSFMRIGTLLRMLAGDTENTKKITDWMDEILAGALENIAADDASLNVLAVGKDLSFQLTPPDVDTPYIFYINHPSLIPFANTLNDIDRLAYLTDKLWYCGAVTDEQREMSNKKLLFPITAPAEHFNLVTKVAQREGGQYSPERFLELLRKEKDMHSFIMTHFTDDEPMAELVKRRVGLA